MKQWPNEITPLPQRTRSILRSTVILTSLVQVVSELIQNSLDANARSIQVGIDCDDWSCWVQDDGTGFAIDSLELLANYCKAGSMRYSTSKVPDGDHTSFGFRGEALSSIADLSILEISSKAAKARQSWSVILKGTDVLFFGPSTRWHRQSAGTTVYVRDAFHNLPVRRIAHMPSARTLELVRRDIETYALVFPNVSFQLKHFRTEAKIMTIPKMGSTLEAFRRIFGRTLVQQTYLIDSSYDSLKLEGFISLTGTLTKTYQFLYINKHPMVSCDLHRLIDRKFSASTFARDAYDAPEGPSRKGPQPGLKKGEKRPVYVLNITIPPIFVDNHVEPSKSAVNIQNHTVLHSFLSDIVQEFLVRNSFAKPPLQVQLRDDPVRSPRKRRRIADHKVSIYSPSHSQQSYRAAEFYYNPSTQNTVQSGSSECSGSCDGCSSCCDECLYVCEGNNPNPGPLDGAGYGDDHLESEVCSISDEGFDAQGGGEVVWADPSTGESFIVNMATGNSRRALGQSEGNINLPRRTLVATSRDDDQEHEIPSWVGEALAANKVYIQKEKPIPAVPHSDAFMSDMRHYELQKQLQYKKSIGQASNSSYRFSRDDLKEVIVVNQVDSKFVACLLSSSSVTDDADYGLGVSSQGPSRTLMLVDQHAADERVRVEWLQREICLAYLRSDDGAGVKRIFLDPPVPVLLTRHEKLVLRRSREIRALLASWGVEFAPIKDIGEEDSSSDDDGNYSQVTVTSIPEIVGNKLSSEDDLQGFIKGVLGDWSSDLFRGPPATSLPPHHEDVFSWKRALRNCPTQLLELLNSKACRGAIMFNDSLTLEQCKELMGRLAHTSVPFRCAHGRPSIVPLVDLGPPPDIRVARRRVNWEAYEEYMQAQARTFRPR